MLNLLILQSPNLTVQLILLPLQPLLPLDELFDGFDKYFLTEQFFSSRVWQNGRLLWVFTLKYTEGF